MTGSELLTQIYYAYRGKGASRVPAWGSEKANTAIAIANRKKDEWARDPNNRWQSLFAIRNDGTVDVNDTTYPLDADFIYPSDEALVTKTDGSEVYYPIVPPQRRNDFSQAIYITGNAAKVANFAHEIDSGLDGGTLSIPGYYLPADLANDDDVVSVDDPIWLALATAAELARNDASKEDQFNNLMGMANDRYEKMVLANNGGAYNQPMNVPNNMPAVGATTDEWYA